MAKTPALKFLSFPAFSAGNKHDKGRFGGKKGSSSFFHIENRKVFGFNGALVVLGPTNF